MEDDVDECQEDLNYEEMGPDDDGVILRSSQDGRASNTCSHE
jgi:hypothetical protein